MMGCAEKEDLQSKSIVFITFNVSARFKRARFVYLE